MLFESLGAAALHIEPPQTLAIWGASNSVLEDGNMAGVSSKPPRTGCVVDIGHCCTTIMPVFEGYPIPASGTSSVYGIGGDDLTTFMERLLEARFPAWSSARHLGGGSDPATARGIARRVKEETAFASEDFARDMEAAVANEKTFECEFLLKLSTVQPSNQSSAAANGGKSGRSEQMSNNVTNVLSIGSERFRCVEPLFQPALVGKRFAGSGSAGVAEHVLRAVEDEDDEIQRDLLGFVVLAGATIRIPGLVARFTQELQDLNIKRHNSLRMAGSRTTDPKKLKVVAAPDPENTAWRGASRMASEDGFVEYRTLARSQ